MILVRFLHSRCSQDPPPGGQYGWIKTERFSVDFAAEDGLKTRARDIRTSRCFARPHPLILERLPTGACLSRCVPSRTGLRLDGRSKAHSISPRAYSLECGV